METIGGQALIEGVLMRNKDKISIAVRKNKKIILKRETIKFKESKKPFIRGIINLISTMYVGMKALNYSASIQLNKKEKENKFMNIITIIIAVIFALFLFKFLPLLLTQFIDNNLNLSSASFNIIDGIIKLTILIMYIYIISRMKDIKRVFQYHGAEHKAVNCYESKISLTIKNVKKFSTIHKRCGTTFIFLVIFISIIIYIFIPKEYSFPLKLSLRILLLPIIASISYEVLKLSAKYNNIITRTITCPGLLIQKLTTNEPDNKQIEVAIKALKGVI